MYELDRALRDLERLRRIRKRLHATTKRIEAIVRLQDSDPNGIVDFTKSSDSGPGEQVKTGSGQNTAA